MQKLFTCFSVFLLVNAALKAQSQFVPAKKEITITTVNGSCVTTGKNSPLIISDFIAVQNGDKITIQPNLLAAPKQHNFLKGALKSTGAFLLTQQVNKTIGATGSKAGNNATAKTNPIPAIGIGLAAGLPNIIKGLKSKKTYIVYSTYDGHKNLLSAQTIKLNKQNNSLTFSNVNTDGFVKIVLLAKRKNIVKGDMNISIEAAKINGGIAESFNLNSFGDCNGEGSICACLAGCNLTVSNCLDDADGPYVIRMLFCSVLPTFLSIPCITAANQAHDAAVYACNNAFADCEKFCKETFSDCK